jgi:hypothetical protein
MKNQLILKNTKNGHSWLQFDQSVRNEERDYMQQSNADAEVLQFSDNAGTDNKSIKCQLSTSSYKQN